MKLMLLSLIIVYMSELNIYIKGIYTIFVITVMIINRRKKF
ncbi:MAG: hypothetical protein KatS3mg002_1580 [Candidatus Woesearchaeota archaeon]|nr:MAG: hypothetical protein KatS3mg002_1580 [Candidatus Woesearchaeota archaeon]